MRLAGVAPTASSAPSLASTVSSKAAVYILDSTAGMRTGHILQSRPPAECQLRCLNGLIAERTWSPFRTYRDRLTGGKQSRSSLEHLINDAEMGRFQIALFFSFACFADSLRQLVVRLNRLKNASVEILCVHEQLDSTTSEGRKAFDLVEQLVGFEGSIRAERIREGLRRIERVGTRSGLPPGRPRIDFDVVKVCELHERGLSQREIAVQLGVGLGTVHRTVKEERATRRRRP